MNIALKNIFLTLITITVLAAPTYGYDLMIGKKFPPEFSKLGNRPCSNQQGVPDLVDLVISKSKKIADASGATPIFRQHQEKSQ